MRRLFGLTAVLVLVPVLAEAQGPAPTTVISANRCDVTLSAPTPATGTGWRVQFYRDNEVPVGNRDNTAPFSVFRNDIPAGNHQFYYRLSTSSQVLPPSPATATVKCELAQVPPNPPPCVVAFPDNPETGWFVVPPEQICKSATNTRTVTERRFATVSPLMCQPVPEVMPTQDRVKEVQCVPTPPTSGEVIAPPAFTYKGFYRMPLALGGAEKLAVEPGGVLSFYSFAGEILYKYNRPNAPPSKQYATAPTVVNVTQVGYPYWNIVPCNEVHDIQDASGCWISKKESFEYPGGARRDQQLFNVHGIAWVAGKLYYTFLDFYNSVFGATDHALGVTDLSKNEKTRWAGDTLRALNSNVKLWGGSVTLLPDGRLGFVGSFGALSRNTDNSHGTCWSEAPVPTTAGGFNSVPLSLQTTMCYSISNKMPRVGDYIPDRTNPYNPDLEPVAGTGYWTQVDRCDVAVKIETLSGKRGLVFMCGFGTGQIWYGHYSAGPNGAVDPCNSSTRGENAQGYRPEWRIYDPVGLKVGHNDPVHTFNPQTKDNIPWDDWWFPCKNYASGAYWNKPTNELFVLAGGQLHVWVVQP